MSHLAPCRRWTKLPALVVLLWLATAMPSGPASCAMQQDPAMPRGVVPQGIQPNKPPPLFPEDGARITPKQRREILKSRFAKTKTDVQQLYEMTKKLRDDMEKSNADELNLKLVNRAAQIEKLARKIKNESRGF